MSRLRRVLLWVLFRFRPSSRELLLGFCDDLRALADDIEAEARVKDEDE